MGLNISGPGLYVCRCRVHARKQDMQGLSIFPGRFVCLYVAFTPGNRTCKVFQHFLAGLHVCHIHAMKHYAHCSSKFHGRLSHTFTPRNRTSVLKIYGPVYRTTCKIVQQFRPVCMYVCMPCSHHETWPAMSFNMSRPACMYVTFTPGNRTRNVSQQFVFTPGNVTYNTVQHLRAVVYVCHVHAMHQDMQGFSPITRRVCMYLCRVHAGTQDMHDLSTFPDHRVFISQSPHQYT